MIVIGTGIAGLSTAIFLKKKGYDVVVLSKEEELQETNTYYAQGGIIGPRPEDSSQQLKEDILEAGYHYNSIEAVNQIAYEGPQLVKNFLIDEVGVKFSCNEAGEFDYTGEAAHSIKRVLHYKDTSGEQFENSLLAYARKLDIKILSSYVSIDIITNNHHSRDTRELYKEREVMGIYALDEESGEVKKMLSHYTVLATGGIGALYKHTTNSEVSTGDGLTMAYRTGADIINAEMVQFHPTALFHKDIKGFLISESVRGEGARLIDHDGSTFMEKYAPEQKDLAPRDVVARAIYSEINSSGKDYMLLDVASYYEGEKDINKRFSRIYETCKEGGIDITKEPIPIVPVAHYFCGGIKVDIFGKTSIKRLFAVGETSCTGVHGANRLASCSLLEGVLWPQKAAEEIDKNFKPIEKNRFAEIPEWKSPKETEKFDNILLQQDWESIKLTMWNYAGIVRTRHGLKRANADLNYYTNRIFDFYNSAELRKNIIELRNGVVAASAIVRAAMHNKKSIGCHYLAE
ncbi:MAG: L-aspartate oxidase [Candidatus Cloacimonetes bacterium]|nr:L-aspartate oxidase [Candidatus Cloacimonadota bacterium]